MKSIIKKYITYSNQGKSGDIFISLIPLLYFILLIATGTLILLGIKTTPIASKILPELQGDILIISSVFFLLGFIIISTLYVKLKKAGLGSIENTESGKAALESSDKKYKTVFDRSPVAIIQFDKNLIITEYNPEL